MPTTITIKVTAETKEAEAAAKRVEKAFTSAADTSSKSVNGLTSAFGGLKSILGTLAGLGIANIFKQIADASLQAAINIDKSRQTLVALTGSLDAANKKLADLRRLAQSSPGVTTSFATTLFTQLTAIGNIAEPTINKVIKSLGKLNAAFTIDDPNGFAKNLVQIFTQSFERADIKEALGRVPIFEQILEQAFGTKDPDKLRALKASGKLTLDAFLQGISGAIETDPRFKQIQESIGSRLAKAKDNILTALAPFGDELGKILLPILEDVTKAIEKFGPLAVEAFKNSTDEILILTKQVGNLILEIGRIGSNLGGFISLENIVRRIALQVATFRDFLVGDAGDFFASFTEEGGSRERALKARFRRLDDRTRLDNINANAAAANQLNSALGFLPDLTRTNSATGDLARILSPTKTRTTSTDDPSGNSAAAKKAAAEAKKRAEEIKDLQEKIREGRDEFGKGIIEELEGINKQLRAGITEVDSEEAARARRLVEQRDTRRKLTEEFDAKSAAAFERNARRDLTRSGRFIDDAFNRGQLTQEDATALTQGSNREIANRLRELSQQPGFDKSRLDDLRDEIELFDRLGQSISNSERFLRGFNSATETVGDAFERFGANVSKAFTNVSSLFTGLKNAIKSFFNDLLGLSLQGVVRQVLGPIFGAFGGGGAAAGGRSGGGGGAGGFLGNIFGGLLGGGGSAGGGGFLTPGFNPNAGGVGSATGIFANGVFGAALGGSTPRQTGFGSILPTASGGLSKLLGGLGIGKGGALGALGLAGPLLGATLGSSLGGTSTLGKIAGAIGGGAVGLGAAFGASVFGAGGGFAQAALAFAGPAALIGIPLLVGAILLGKAAQRRKDEAASGDFLTQALAGIRTLGSQIGTDQIDGAQAKAIFENQILAQFIQQIGQLKTKSVRDSRLTNQVRDLRKVYDTEIPPEIEAQRRRKRVNSSLVPEFATGGVVPGFNRGFDSVHALLTPGEMVLTKGQQGAIAAMAGAGVFQAAGVPDAGVATPGGEAFAFGGKVSGSTGPTIFLGDITLVIGEDDARGIFVKGAQTDDGQEVLVRSQRQAQRFNRF